MDPSQPQTRTGLRDRPGAPMPVPAYLYHTDFCPEFRTVGLKVDSQLKSLEQERDLRAEVEREKEKIRSGALREKDKLRFERLDAETRFFLGNAQAPLMTSESNNWQPDRDLHAWSPEPTHMKKAHDEIISQDMDTWIREHDEEKRQRATTLKDMKDMKEIVQTLTTQLNEQMEILNQATENQAKLEAENQRLQQLLDTRAKQYQERRQSQEEKALGHAATPDKRAHSGDERADERL